MECRNFLKISWHPFKEFSWFSIRIKVNCICKRVGAHENLSGSWTSAQLCQFGGLPCYIFIGNSLWMLCLGGGSCPLIYDLRTRFILSALMKQISISSLDQTISRVSCHPDQSFSGFFSPLAFPQSRSQCLPPSLCSSRLLSVTWNAYPHSHIQLLCVHKDPQGCVHSLLWPLTLITLLYLLLPLGSPGSWWNEGKGRSSSKWELINLTNSYLLQSVSFPLFHDLQARKRTDMFKKAFGHFFQIPYPFFFLLDPQGWEEFFKAAAQAWLKIIYNFSFPCVFSMDLVTKSNPFPFSLPQLGTFSSCTSLHTPFLSYFTTHSKNHVPQMSFWSCHLSPSVPNVSFEIKFQSQI